MFWLFLLGIVTFLTIVLRRVLRRLRPLAEQLSWKNIAIEHVQTGVAWVRENGKFGSTNQAFARTLNQAPRDLVGRDWHSIFPEDESDRVHEAYSQALLSGMSTFDISALRPDGSRAWVNVRLVAVHDRAMRFAGHHCLIEDHTREHELESQLNALKAAIRESESAIPQLVS